MRDVAGDSGGWVSRSSARASSVYVAPIAAKVATRAGGASLKIHEQLIAARPAASAAPPAAPTAPGRREASHRPAPAATWKAAIV